MREIKASFRRNLQAEPLSFLQQVFEMIITLLRKLSLRATTIVPNFSGVIEVFVTEVHVELVLLYAESFLYRRVVLLRELWKRKKTDRTEEQFYICI